MAGQVYCQDIKGLQTIFSQKPDWPGSANRFVIPDHRGFCMIDVGCGGPSCPGHLLEGLEQLGLDLQDLHTVVLSHAHPDHMGAMSWILEQINPRVLIHHLDVVSALNPANLVNTFDIPLSKRLWAAAEDPGPYLQFDLFNFFGDCGCTMTGAREVEELHEGQVLSLGDFSFEVIHTPGHSPGHVSFFERERGLLLAGDLVGAVLAWYNPTSGGVIGYLDSLDKLEALEAEIILPAHGPVMEDPRQGIRKMRDKLLKREAILLEGLQEGPRTFLELNAYLFQVPEVKFFPGCGNTAGHLDKLERDGVIRRDGNLISLG